MNETQDYTKLLPDKPPEGMIQWLISKGQLSEEFIIYRSAYVTDPLTDEKEKMVEITCTDCGGSTYMPRIPGGGCHNAYAPAPFGYYNEEYAEGIISGDVTQCPLCGAEAKALHIGSIRNVHNTEAVFPMSVHIIDGKLALLGWCIYKSIGKDGSTTYIQHPYEGYVFDGKMCTRLNGYSKFMNSVSFFCGWRQLKRCNDIWGKTSCDGVFPWDSGILNGTAFENSHLDEYMKAKEIYPVTYMRLWQKHKNIENLVVQGASALLSDMIRKNCMYSGYYGQSNIPTLKIPDINWKEKRPSKMLGLSKEEFRYAVKAEWNAATLDFYKGLKAYNIRTEDMPICNKFYKADVVNLAKGGHSVIKTLRYIARQQNRCNSEHIGVSYIMDYWRMAAQNGADPTDNDVKYPQNIVNAHDAEVRKIKYKEDKALIENFKKRYEELSRFCWSDGVLEIHPAVDEKEMIVEGKILHHCVATYAESHAGGGTAIFFIRHCAEPEQPYFTLELDENKLVVKQNRGLRNCDRTDEVIDFEKKWLEYIKKEVEKENRKHGRTDTAA